MKAKIIFGILILLISSLVFSESNTKLRVFISVDMEGIAGVVNWEDVSRNGKDYDYFRKIMTEETNAAIEAAFSVGATYVLVRDSHGSARNILPEELDKRAVLLRDWEWESSYKGMMEGIDESFDAVLFIGYHAKANTPNAILDHTMNSGSIADVSVNGVSLPEAGINALIAGKFDVPVIFVAGDQAICDQSKQLFKKVITVAVKKGIGNSSLGLHPFVARTKIKNGVKKALKRVSEFKPFKMKPPFILKVQYRKESYLNKKIKTEGCKKTGPAEITYKNDQIIPVLKTMIKLL